MSAHSCPRARVRDGECGLVGSVAIASMAHMNGSVERGEASAWLARPV